MHTQHTHAHFITIVINGYKSNNLIRQFYGHRFLTCVEHILQLFVNALVRVLYNLCLAAEICVYVLAKLCNSGFKTLCGGAPLKTPAFETKFKFIFFNLGNKIKIIRHFL